MIATARLRPRYLVNERGGRTAVVLSMRSFKRLMEDMEDLAVAAERKKEPAVSHKALLTELRRDGLL